MAGTSRTSPPGHLHCPKPTERNYWPGKAFSYYTKTPFPLNYAAHKIRIVKLRAILALYSYNYDSMMVQCKRAGIRSDSVIMRIFISYAHMDRSFAQKLRKDLSDQNLDAQLADDILQPGDLITDKIAEEIIKADAFIIVLSRKSTNRTWLSYELAAATAAQSKGSLRAIIPVVIEKRVEIPFVLKDRQYVDFSDQRDYTKSFKSLISSLKDLPDRTPQREKDSLKRQFEVVLSAQMALKSEKIAYQEKHSTQNLRFFGFFAISMGIIALLALGMIGIVFGNSSLKLFFVAAMGLYFGVAVYAFVSAGKAFKEWTRIEHRNQGRNNE